MNHFDDVLKKIRENFSPRKEVDFKKEGLHFEMEPLTSKEEVIVLESCKDIGDSEYIEALKRHTLACSIKHVNGLEIPDTVDAEGGSKSRFLYLIDFLAEWPSGLIDVLFDAFTHMQKENEAKIKENAKFDKFALSEEIEDEETRGEFRRIVEDASEGLTEAEKLKEKVDKEVEEADNRRMDVEQAQREKIEQ